MATHSNLRGARIAGTLNAAHGYYVRTGLQVEPVCVVLYYRALDGTVAEAGKFPLDLPSLVAAKTVAARSRNGQLVADVKISRRSDGSYWLQGPAAIRVL